MKTKCLQWKKVGRMALLALFLTMVGIEESLAIEFTVGYFKYTTNGTNTVMVRKKGASIGGNLTIPSTVTYNNVTYTVNEVGPDAFYQCDGLTGITIPNTVTTISARAFLGCTGLTGALVIPTNVTVIGDHAYKGCTGLTGIVMNNSLSKIGDGVFYQCTNLTGDLVFPNSVTKIGSTAFEECTGYHGALVLPEGLSEISDNTFKNCNFTGNLVIPSSVTTIGNAAFSQCTGFSGDLILPNSMIKIMPNAFSNCTGLRGILLIPNSMSLIYGYAFQNCKFSAIYCAAATPPSTASLTFSGMNMNTPVYVPVAKVSAYQNANNWKNFNHIYGACFFIGTTNQNWSVSTNWSAGSMPQNASNVIVLANSKLNSTLSLNTLLLVNGGVVDVLSGNTLTVSGNLANKGSYDNLVVEDGAQLKLSNSGVPAKVKKNITAYSQSQNVNNGWYLLSYPMANSGLIDMQENLASNNYDLYYYDEPTHYWINQENPNSGYNQLNAGKGYLYANSANVTIGFTGELKKSSDQVVIPLDYTAGMNLTGFNLVGNPFAQNMGHYQGVNVVENCYRMNEDGSDLIISYVTPNDPLKPTEGFFVKATGANATVTFNPENVLKTPKPRYINFEVVENEKVIDRLMVKRGQGNSMEKLSINNGTKLYVMEEAEKKAMVYCDTDEQPIGFKSAKNGLCTFRVTVMGLEIDYLHLIDNVTGMDIDLLASPTYSFEASTIDTPDRFELLFAPRPETDYDEGIMGCFANVVNDDVLIMDAEGGTLEVIDMLGHIISSKAVYGNDRINLSSGVYVLRLIKGDEVKTQKIVIR